MAERKRTKPARYELGEPLNSELEDLSEAYKGAPVAGLVREAVRDYIAKCLDQEPMVRARYHEARKKRLRNEGRQLTVVENADC